MTAPEVKVDPAAPDPQVRQPEKTNLRRRRLRLRWAWKRAKLYWQTFTGAALSLTAVAVAVMIAMLLMQALTSRTLTIEPIAVPKELADRGFVPEVAARRLRDAIHTFVTNAQTSMKQPEVALRGDVPDIVVPTVGISLDSIAAAIRGFLHSNTRRSVSGEFTIADNTLWLRLRLDGREIYSSKTGGKLDKPDDLLTSSVSELLKRIQPFVVAQSFYLKDSEQSLKIAEDIIFYLPESNENVVNCYILEASIYTDRAQYADATAAVEHAIKIDGRLVAAYNMLGNILPTNTEMPKPRRYIGKRSPLTPRSHGPMRISA